MSLQGQQVRANGPSMMLRCEQYIGLARFCPALLMLLRLDRANHSASNSFTGAQSYMYNCFSKAFFILTYHTLQQQIDVSTAAKMTS